MTLRLFGCVCGQFHSPGSAMGMAGQRVSVPVPFYVIEHPGGVVLFDAGLPAGMCDPDEAYLQMLRAHDLDVTMDAETTVTRCLERLDIDPGAVRQVVVSHLHFDHVGGLSELPNAGLIVQRREWEAGFEPEAARRYALRKRYFDLGHPVTLVDGEHDLFGDGAVVCLPSFGHTPGHQSLRVRSGQGDHLLMADACYHCEVISSRRFPETADHVAMGEALDGLLAACDPATVMVFGHDPGQWGEHPVLPDRRA